MRVHLTVAELLNTVKYLDSWNCECARDEPLNLVHQHPPEDVTKHLQQSTIIVFGSITHSTMTSFASATAFLLASVVVLHSSAATITQKSIDEFDLPLDKEWMSLSKTVDFIPASDQGSPLLRNAQKRLLNYYKEDFVDGLETQYNEYAQAWRYLGLFMDCDYVAQAQRRSLAADDGTVCKRYLLWAAVSGASLAITARMKHQPRPSHLPDFYLQSYSTWTWTIQETDSLNICFTTQHLVPGIRVHAKPPKASDVSRWTATRR
jgi:hypothetical protein